MGRPLLEARVFGNLHERLTFLTSKTGNEPLLEHGSLIEILLYNNMFFKRFSSGIKEYIKELKV